MKRIIITVAVCLLALTPALAQKTTDGKINRDGIELKTGKRAELRLRAVFPMYFGVSTLTGTDYQGLWASSPLGGFLDTKLIQNFNYNLEMVGIRLYSRGLPVEATLGMRWTFMDFSLANTAITFEGIDGPTPSAYIPAPIITQGYDGTKSKIHASYIGLPLRIAFKLGADVKLFAGVAGEYLVKGYTKYRNPSSRTTTNALFSPFRGSVEGGISYAGWGLYASYGLTPLFQPDCSNARTLSFGLVLGL